MIPDPFDRTETDVSDECPCNTIDLMQNKIYSLIKERAMTVAEIAQSLALRKTEAYGLLMALQNKRLIMARSKEPIKFIACNQK